MRCEGSELTLGPRGRGVGVERDICDDSERVGDGGRM
jgi:hypothetical protein